LAVVAIVLAACGDNVPSSGAVCGAGTILQNGVCVPDTSMFCAQGTKYDPASGQCIVDPSACKPGTAYVGGACVPEDDALSAQLQESAEPNDQSTAGAFAAPAIGTSVTFHGCITPQNGARDIDIWAVTATGPTLLEITIDGVHGLDGG